MSSLKSVKSALGRLTVPIVRHAKKLAAVLEWRLKGSPVLTSDAVKPATLIAFASERGLRVLVETGTYLGGTIDGTRTHFEEIWSIELDERLHAAVAKRYRDEPHIHLLRGDSASVLPQVLRKLDRPALFWLDAHYSTGLTAWVDRDTPVMQELGSIMRHPVRGHAILVDDARLFGADPAYPTLEQVQSLVAQLWPAARVTVANDIIRIA